VYYCRVDRTSATANQLSPNTTIPQYMQAFVPLHNSRQQRSCDDYQNSWLRWYCAETSQIDKLIKTTRDTTWEVAILQEPFPN
jgi:hypothetical protein